MTSDNHYSLTIYQRAILTHLGITPWRLRSHDSEIAETQSTQTQSRPRQITDKPSLLQRQAGLEKLKEAVSVSNKVAKQTISIPEQVLILIDQNNKNLRFIKDVLQAVGLESNKIRFTQTSQRHEFSDYRFLWSILDSAIEENNTVRVEFAGHQLTTTQIDSDNAAALKKQLWQVLQNHKILELLT